MGCDVSEIIKKRRGAAESSELPEKRILLLGLDNAGKTSILIQYKENTFMQASVPTIGLNIEQVEFRGYNLTFWDVGGQATRLWKHYFDSIDGVFFAIDSSDKERLVKARDELHRLGRDASLSGVPYVIMINKCDLESRQPLDEILKKLDLEILSKERQVHCQECSALSGEGLWEGLACLVDIFDKQSNKMSDGGTAAGGSTGNPSASERVTSGDASNMPQSHQKPIEMKT